ncbi:MAG: sulfite exporter TauE/SafE family protein [Deltaproteobacteria bacterium]|nr:sulfite exporter TauE/SafE family protein [Myxococcales bacterium]MDP3218738.1 sulfite exporter TauE/SafE family protein [Deltaproteobacteria bacterium]
MVALAALVMVAIALESIVGFGATVLVLSLGTWVLPVTALLPAYIPVNMALSASIAWRDWRHVDGALLARRVLPMAGAGLLVGLSLYRYAARPELQRAFGVMVVLIGLNELRKEIWAPASVAVGRARGNALLAAGGVVHGVFGTGGVLIVAALAGDRLEKRRMRATLAAMWLVMNTAMMVNFIGHGAVGATSLRRSALLLPAVALGGALGDWVHRRVAERPFRIGMALVMTAAGVATALR